jgi:hypothetical protein
MLCCGTTPMPVALAGVGRRQKVSPKPDRPCYEAPVSPAGVSSLSPVTTIGRRGGSAIHAALHYSPPPVVGALITTQRVLASGLP